MGAGLGGRESAGTWNGLSPIATLSPAQQTNIVYTLIGPSYNTYTHPFTLPLLPSCPCRPRCSTCHQHPSINAGQVALKDPRHLEPEAKSPDPPSPRVQSQQLSDYPPTLPGPYHQPMIAATLKFPMPEQLESMVPPLVLWCPTLRPAQ